MSGYLLREIELSEPLPCLSLDPGTEGVALSIRRRGRPVGFAMAAVDRTGVLDPDFVRDLVASAAACSILEQALREELVAQQEDVFRAWPSVTVVVCTRDRPQMLRRCLASIFDLRVPEKLDLEVMVVDNAPSDAPTREEAERAGARYVVEAIPGLDFARNRALRESSRDFVAFVDDDVIVDREWLGGFLDAWADNPDAAAVTGLVLPMALDTRAQVLFELRGGFRRGFRRVRFGPSLAENELYPAGAGVFGAGCNMILRREIALGLGGFDEALDTGPPLPGGGDLDMFYRIVRSGRAIVYDPRCLVFHEHRKDLKGLRRQYWSWGLGFMSFLSKTHDADPEERPRIRGMTRWWFGDQLVRAAKRILGREVTPLPMIAAELFGGAQGLFGGYERSRRRVRRIRALLDPEGTPLAYPTMENPPR